MRASLDEMFVFRKIRRLKELRKSGYTWWELFVRFLMYLHIYPWRGYKLFQTCEEIRKIKKLHKVNQRKVKKDKTRIAVIETGVLGDCMLVLHAFQSLASWCEKNNILLDVVCSASMANLFSKTGSVLPANYITFQNRECMGDKDYEKLAELISGKHYRYVLMRDSNRVAFRIAALFSRDEAIYYSYDVSRIDKVSMWYAKKYFTEVKNISECYFIPEIWKRILHRIGMAEYQTSMGNLEVFGKLHYERPYIVISPEASTTDRNLTEEQCIHLIELIQIHYPKYQLILSSVAKTPTYTELLQQMVKKYNLVDFIGNTTMEQYLELIAGAVLVIGCDSGSVHLSAALGVQAICYSGYWDLPYFVPYKYDVRKENDKYPIVLYSRKKPACAYCGTRSDVDICSEYLACMKRREQRLTFFCLANIAHEDVESAVSKCLSI